MTEAVSKLRDGLSGDLMRLEHDIDACRARIQPAERRAAFDRDVVDELEQVREFVASVPR
jgi:hypothetical protein